jgi:hypothetical protein
MDYYTTIVLNSVIKVGHNNFLKHGMLILIMGINVDYNNF